MSKLGKVLENKRLGRPPLPPEKRKRSTMGFRPTPAIRKKLEESASATGLSLTQEVERRLDRTFEEDENRKSVTEFVCDSFGGKIIYRFLQVIASAGARIEQVRERPVYEDKEGWMALKEAANQLFDEFIPDDQKQMSSPLLLKAARENAETLGRQVAELEVSKIKIAVLRQELKKLGVTPDDLIGGG
ncbi:MAG: hypothetical protein O3C34_03780 [Proteobacteria bacterium]|nr:hypothetical protein [Pseudomonadota bacterium]